jgi:spermidine/putrescine transport system permease protein
MTVRNGRAIGPIVALLYLFLYVPLLILGVFSFNSSRFTVWEDFSTKWYAAVFADRQMAEATLNSILIAILATTIATVIGTLAAYGLWKKASKWISTGLYVSLVTPEIVAGVSLLAFYQWMFRYLNLQLGMMTVVLAHVSFCIAFVVTVVIARLRTMDASLEEAAQDLGASPLQAFLRVTLPLLMPGIVSAALLAFTISFDDYVITSLVAGVDSETLPMLIYGIARRGASPVLNSVSTLITLATGVVVIGGEFLKERGISQ